MPQRPGFTPRSLGTKIFLCLLAIAYLGYWVALATFLHPLVVTPTITEHIVDKNPEAVVRYWTVDSMRRAIDVDEVNGNLPDLTQGNTNVTESKSALRQGVPPRNGESSYPLSTVGKVFFTDTAGRGYVCSGTAVVSDNQSVVDTAGHCLWNSNWMQNVIFCPLYDNGSTPYGCWAAHELVVPADWIEHKPNDLHHDMGIAIVSPNSQGLLTTIVGGAGWAYNQTITQPFYAYGYPAAYPFDGQTRQSCAEGSHGRSWKHGGGTVISIPCNMTGGSSGGPWFIKVDGNWYLNGHNDFISRIQPGHMFSPYYDDTWYALYDKAQHA
jgi:V8-like Glu-specific endopeptidase